MNTAQDARTLSSHALHSCHGLWQLWSHAMQEVLVNLYSFRSVRTEPCMGEAWFSGEVPGVKKGNTLMSCCPDSAALTRPTGI